MTVNIVAKADVYHLLRIEDMLNKVAGGNTFTKFDLTTAYQQLKFAGQSKDLTIINTPKWLFRLALTHWRFCSCCHFQVLDGLFARRHL